ncbi:hypothetical protein CVT24_001229 [Panaeolus cyanescens]|uniref:Uncharacterized protein n=1 Tax=Panaeolus cyanescens TaxID=181874 RepID=A0A409YYW2_9AGAR|nr:hypothetical protein CVT24_001229 [Panaeolus cyanescens]
MSFNLPPMPPPMPATNSSALIVAQSNILIKFPARVEHIGNAMHGIVTYFNSPRATSYDAPKVLVIDVKTDQSIHRRSDTDLRLIYDEFSYLLDMVSGMRSLQSLDINITNYHDSCPSDAVFAAVVQKLSKFTRRPDIVKFKLYVTTFQSNMAVFGPMCGQVMDGIAQSRSCFSEEVRISLAVAGGAGNTAAYAEGRQAFIRKARNLRAARPNSIFELFYRTDIAPSSLTVIVNVAAVTPVFTPQESFTIWQVAYRTICFLLYCRSITELNICVCANHGKLSNNPVLDGVLMAVEELAQLPRLTKIHFMMDTKASNTSFLTAYYSQIMRSVSNATAFYEEIKVDVVVSGTPEDPNAYVDFCLLFEEKVKRLQIATEGNLLVEVNLYEK